MVYFAVRRVRQLTAQTFDINGVSLDNTKLIDIATLPLKGGSGQLGLIISNFAKKGYKIDNLNIEVYSLSNELIAYQTNPLTKAIEILPEANNIVQIPMFFKAAFFKQMYNQLKDKYTNVAELVQNWLDTNHLGTEVVIKGFAMKAGNKINFKFNKVV